MFVFTIILILCNILIFNSILNIAFTFLLFLFINFIGINLSIVLLSFIGIIFLCVWILLNLGFTFLGASLGLVYIGAILVLFLYLLILINQDEKININYNTLNIYLILIIIFENIFKKYSFFKYSTSIFQIIPTNTKFYFLENLELEVFSSIFFIYNFSLVYNLSLYLIISSIMILKLLKNLF
jgi:NADH:ubiquinone oxidoreductase subunit 6 (subunit J)